MYQYTLHKGAGGSCISYTLSSRTVATVVSSVLITNDLTQLNSIRKNKICLSLFSRKKNIRNISCIFENLQIIHELCFDDLL